MKFKVLFILFAFSLFFVSVASASQEVVETHILSGFLNENFKMIKDLLKVSHSMQYVAQPFTRKRHRERFRFQPNDKQPRQVMTYSRRLTARFKIINGLLSHSDIPNRQLLFDEIFESTESINTYGKRAVRAIRDNNYVLYLASSKGLEKEVFHLNKLLDSLENAINGTISESDSAKENL